MSEAIIVAIVGAGAAVIGGIIGGMFSRPKTKAETDKTFADTNEQIRETVMALIDPLKKRVEELEREVRALQCENLDLRTWAEALVEQIKSLGKEPVAYVRRVKRS
jgi:regulator of replication initiation timing